MEYAGLFKKRNLWLVDHWNKIGPKTGIFCQTHHLPLTFLSCTNFIAWDPGTACQLWCLKGNVLRQGQQFECMRAPTGYGGSTDIEFRILEAPRCWWHDLSSIALLNGSWNRLWEQPKPQSEDLEDHFLSFFWWDVLATAWHELTGNLLLVSYDEGLCSERWLVRSWISTREQSLHLPIYPSIHLTLCWRQRM